MITQNNPTPWIILILIILLMCGTLGVIIGLDPFGPGQDFRAEQAKTQLAMNAPATEGYLKAIETPQSIHAGETVVVEFMTAMPPAQTATALAVQADNISRQISGTQTAVAFDSGIQDLGRSATREAIGTAQSLGDLFVAATTTAVAQSTVTEGKTENATIILAVIGAATFCILIVGRASANLFRLRTQEKIAQARLLMEQRRLAEFQALQKSQYPQRSSIQTVIPSSMLNHSGNGRGIPRGE